MIAFPFKFDLPHWDAQRTALLDAEIIAYKCAAIAERDGESEADAVDRAVSMARSWAEAARATDAIACLSGGNNFRRKIFPAYKASRKGKPKPVFLRACIDAMYQLGAYAYHDDLEADDVMGILATNRTLPNPVIVTIDKDLLQVPGWHCNPDKHCFPVRITPEEAAYALDVQTLAGDSTDGIPGVRGVGVKTAMKKLAEGVEPAHEFETQEDYELNRKLVTILTAGNPDAESYRIQVHPSAKVKFGAIPTTGVSV